MSKKRWKMIRVPIETYEKISALKEKRGKPIWYIIQEAMSFFEAFQRKPDVRTSVDTLDKVAWYLTKLALAYGAFIREPNGETLSQLSARVNELKTRLGVDAELLVRMGEHYMKIRSEEERKKFRITYNMVYKQVVKDVILTTLFEAVSKK